MFFSHTVNVVNSLFREHGKATDRSPHWPSVEHKFKKTQPVCEACGSTKLIQVHHVKPFHLHPELELDPSNLISLCMGPNECHLRIGHGDDFKSYNPNVREDADAVKANTAVLPDIVTKAKTARLKV